MSGNSIGFPSWAGPASGTHACTDRLLIYARDGRHANGLGTNAALVGTLLVSLGGLVIEVVRVFGR